MMDRICLSTSNHVPALLKNRLSILLAAVLILPPFGVVSAGAAQEIGHTSAADDLPPELELLVKMDAQRDYRWTLIGKNDKAAEQAKLHPEFNAVATLWHLPLAANRSALKLVFAHPVRTGNNVFHLYVQADGDKSTGRKDGGIHQGVDYMFTLIDGDPRHSSTRLDVFEADGRGRRGACSVWIRDETLYIVAEMTLRQHEGRSVFDYYVSSYVRDKGPSASLGYHHAVSDPAPQTVDTRLLANPGLVVVNGTVPGWHLVGRGAEEAVLAAAAEEDAVAVGQLYAGGGLVQTASLSPGHYLLRAWIKTDTFATHLGALGFRIPVGVRGEYVWTELPFYVTGSDRDARRPVDVGIWHVGYPPTRHHGEIRVKEMELVRLGDTAMPDRWAETLPVDPLHRLKLLAASPAWERPGKVVFQDAFIGTELWLMTQEGQVDHSYVGHPDFSHEGKYLHIGLRRRPRGLLRTDGSARHLNDAWGGIVWPFPWEQKRLPAGTDPIDWIVTSRTQVGSPGLFTPPMGAGQQEGVAPQSPAGSELLNVATGGTHRVELPSRPGWRIVHFPGIASYGGRGPNMREIDHDALVWLSEHKRSLGRSDMEGESFTAFEVRSISSKPEEDKLEPAMSSVWGKAGDNWRDAVDRDGNRYFLFELNRENLPDHPANPYQAWALPLTPGDGRGLLRVVFNPKVKVTEFLSTHTGMTPQPSFNWWDFAAGLPRSGDNAVLLLEDDTLVHMSSLGMHSSFRDTIHTNCAHSGEVTFLGSYPRLDRITWPHEFRRDRDFAVVASHAEPASPIVMLDLEHATIWTLALTNFHDYAIRYKTRWDKEAYHKPMFRPAPTFSPDFTKVVYFSSMLTGDQPDRIWGDVYVAVARYPEPPANLRKEGGALVWDMPRRHAEIEGFRLYRSGESGQGYARVGDGLLSGARYELPADAEGFYVLTSVEYSGLEGRMFSNEVNVGGGSVFRRYHRPAAGKIARPMAPFFEPAGTADGFAVAVTDPELVYRQQLEEGLSGAVTMHVAIPQAAAVRILARVRGMSALERASYTTGWPAPGEAGRGRFVVRIDGKEAGAVPVEGLPWRWVALDAGEVSLPAGTIELQLATRDAGIAVDHVLVTNDPDFIPQGRGQVPEELAAAPQGLRVEPPDAGADTAASELLKAQAPIVKLAWDPAPAPQGVSHYNVYRSDAESFDAGPETLLGSPREPAFYDVGLQAGKTVYYRVRAVDAWGNQSPASAALAVTAE
ncbi:MAG: fibronectin type III domain-containing protein [Thermoguttaceae bacterium]|nr:fibronectin type III domain-containing protein [Thermoguttaceae bacterium]